MYISGNLSMHKMKVHYRKGNSQFLNVKHSFILGRDTKVIDLKGDKGIIQSIDIWYDRPKGNCQLIRKVSRYFTLFTSIL